MACPTGKVLDEISHKCEENSECPYGQYSEFGKCYNRCPLATVYYEGLCYEYCLDGFVANSFGGCIKIKETCAYPFFDNNNDCIRQCPSNTYVASGRKCEKCSDKCLTCSDFSICLSCPNGLHLKNGVCIEKTPSPGFCSNGLFLHEEDCVTSCPTGTVGYSGACQAICKNQMYFYENQCYTHCPTTFHTSYACFNNCPEGYYSDGFVCYKSQSQVDHNCAFGYYFNSTNNRCQGCKEPCLTC